MSLSSTEEILLKEYELLWEYYRHQIDVLAGFRGQYVKIFLIPASLLATAVMVTSKVIKGEQLIPINLMSLTVGVLIMLALLIGLSMFISYYKELGNLGNYEQAMIRIRDKFRNSHGLSEILVVDTLRKSTPIAKLAPRNPKKAYFRSLLYSLGGTFIVGNSFLASITIGLMLSGLNSTYSNNQIVAVAVVTLVWSFLFQSLWSYDLYSDYSGQSQAPEIEKAENAKN